MRNLDHPHIVRIQDAFEMGHTLYIVMELVSGGDLFDKIIELGRYSEDHARRVLIKVQYDRENTDRAPSPHPHRCPL